MSNSLFASIPCPDNSAHFCNICVDGSVVINGTGSSGTGATGCTGPENSLLVAGNAGIGGNLNICGLTTMGGARNLPHAPFDQLRASGKKIHDNERDELRPVRFDGARSASREEGRGFRSIPCTGPDLRLEVFGDVGITDDLYVCGTIIANGFSGVTGTFNPALPVVFSNTGNASGCTGGSPAVTVLGGEVIYGNLGVGGNLDVCGSINFSGASINTNVLANSAQCNLSVGDNTPNVNTAGMTGTTAVGEGALQNNAGVYNTALGCQALNQLMSGTGNVGIGYQALQNNGTGVSNVAIGYLASQNSVSGILNTAVGAQALQNNTGGASNVAIGALAAHRLGMASDIFNVAIGTSSMAYATNVNRNVAIGQGAMLSASSGGSNIAIGEVAMANAPNCVSNVVIGVNAMSLASGSHYNVALGQAALESASNSSQNVALGFFSMANATGTVTGNVAIGPSTMQSLSGTNNIAIGNSAMMHASNVNVNVAIGFNAMSASSGSSNNVAIGNGPLVNVSGINNVAIGAAACNNLINGSENVAIGDRAMQFAVNSSVNIAIGQNSMRSTSGANNNIAIGLGALVSTQTGSNNIAIGTGAGSALTAGESNDIYLGHTGVAGESNTIRIGMQGTQTKAFMAGIFGVTGATGSAIPVYVSSNGQLGTAASSLRYKKDIKLLGNQSERMLKLRPVSFVYKHDESNSTQFGLIAEEVNEIYPELIVRDEAGEIFTINYMELIPLLLKHIQELESQMVLQQEQHNDQIKEVKEEVTALRVLMAQLLAAHV